MIPSSQSNFGGMDSAFQQLSQLLYLQSLASPLIGKSPMINSQLGQMPMTPKMPSMTQIPSMPSQSSTNQLNLSSLEDITKILSAHQNLKSQISPISSRSTFNPQIMPSMNPNAFDLSQFQTQFQHQNQQTQQRQPEYRIAVTKESAKPLQDWMKENLHHPYPTSEDIFELSKKTGFSHKQIRNWFTNNRRRYEQENSDKPLPWQKKLASNRKSSSPENANSSSISDNIISQISQFISPSKTPKSE